MLLILFLSAVEACQCNLTVTGTTMTCQPETCTDAGPLMIHGSSITKISFPSLTSVFTDFSVYGNPHLETFIAPKLAKVFGNLSVTENPKLISVVFPALEYLQGRGLFDTTTGLPHLDDAKSELKFMTSSSISMIDLPSMIHIGSLVVSGNTALAKISAQKLATVGSIYIVDNPNLAIISFPLLSHVEEGFFVTTSGVKALPLGSLTQAGEIHVYGNPNLSYLSFSSLTTVPKVTIQNNHVLDSVEIQKLHTSKSFSATGLVKTGCVNLTCFQAAPSSFEADWCGHVNKTVPLCPSHTWRCKC